ncbi:MAG: site-specific integrase [Chloroflexota bacterium]
MPKSESNLQQQLSLLEETVASSLSAKSQPLIELPPLTRQASLIIAIGHYCQHLALNNVTHQDLKRVVRDLKLLLAYYEDGRYLARKVTTKELQAFLRWLENRRKMAYPLKRMASHITTLQQFFAFLVNRRIIFPNPATSLVYRPREVVQTDVLTGEEIERALIAAKTIGDKRPRAELVFRLAWATGLRKDECVLLTPDDVDLTEPDEPALIIRSANKQKQWQQRTLRFPPETLAVLDRYLESQAETTDTLFPVSSTTLEQDLQRIGKESTLPGRLTFARLRWTRAVHDQKRGASPTVLRMKLAIADDDWPTVLAQLKRLAAQL